MIPDPRIIENIKKLKELGMSKEDIKDNLLKMGLSSKDSEELIISAFDEKKSTAPETKSEITTEKISESKILSKEIPDNLFSDESKIITTTGIKDTEIIDDTKEIPDITKGLDLGGLDYNPGSKETSFEDFNFDIKPKKEINIKPEVQSTADVWETGLVTTINTKINEVEVRQAKMEEYLKSKIDFEMEKYKKIQETTKQLLMSNINQQITEQISTIGTQMTKQLAMLKIEQVKINKKAEDIISGKSEIENLLSKFQEYQNQMTQTNNQNQENINKIVATTTVKLNAKIKEINNKVRTLDEEIKKIENAQTTIEIAKEKINEINMFKDQFIAIIDKNIEKMNNTMSLIEKRIKEMEERQKALI